MNDDRTYLVELEQALKVRGLDEAHTADVIREISSH